MILPFNSFQLVVLLFVPFWNSKKAFWGKCDRRASRKQIKNYLWHFGSGAQSGAPIPMLMLLFCLTKCSYGFVAPFCKSKKVSWEKRDRRAPQTKPWKNYLGHVWKRWNLCRPLKCFFVVCFIESLRAFHRAESGINISSFSSSSSSWTSQKGHIPGCVLRCPHCYENHIRKCNQTLDSKLPFCSRSPYNIHL